MIQKKSKSFGRRHLQTICPFLFRTRLFVVFLLFASVHISCVLSTTAPYHDANDNNEIIMLTMNDSEREIEVKLGDTIQVELERSGSTGYDWHLDDSYKANFSLLLVEDKQKAGPTSLLGVPMLKQWRLRAIKPGATELAIYLYRNWEGKGKTVEAFKLKVNIE